MNRYETGPKGFICANCGRAQIAHHKIGRYCKSKDGRRWRKSTFKLKEASDDRENG